MKVNFLLSLVAATVSAPDATLNMERNTCAAFAGSDKNAVVDGEFAIIENELRAALKSLCEAGINIVAIHSHMTSEEPQIIFFHYRGRDPAQSLGQSIEKVLPAGTGIPAKPQPSVR